MAGAHVDPWTAYLLEQLQLHGWTSPGQFPTSEQRSRLMARAYLTWAASGNRVEAQGPREAFDGVVEHAKSLQDESERDEWLTAVVNERLSSRSSLRRRRMKWWKASGAGMMLGVAEVSAGLVLLAYGSLVWGCFALAAGGLFAAGGRRNAQRDLWKWENSSADARQSASEAARWWSHTSLRPGNDHS